LAWSEIETLDDAPRTGRPARVPIAAHYELIKLACQRVDEHKAPFREVWTLRALADALERETGIQMSKSEVARILEGAALQPHRVRMWLHSPDPDTRSGRVFGQCRRRTAKGLLAFMAALAKRYPTGPVYVVWDNLNIHHGERWCAFNERHGGRFHFVHTPLHASWVNQIEIWFSILARRVLKLGSFASAAELRRRVLAFITHWNRAEAHPFRWTFRGKWKRVGMPQAA
jgi:hypothetical protein